MTGINREPDRTELDRAGNRPRRGIIATFSVPYKKLKMWHCLHAIFLEVKIMISRFNNLFVFHQHFDMVFTRKRKKSELKAGKHIFFRGSGVARVEFPIWQ